MILNLFLYTDLAPGIHYEKQHQADNRRGNRKYKLRVIFRQHIRLPVQGIHINRDKYDKHYQKYFIKLLHDLKN